MESTNKELVHLARLALEGKTDEVSLLIRRLARKLRDTSPDVAEALTKLAKKGSIPSQTRGSSVAGLPVDLETRLELARVENDIRFKHDPLWQEGVGRTLRQTVEERENLERLAKADLVPTRSLLFVGPPGVGKTLSARWLAGKLHTPLITLDLSAVMSSYLGRTGNNLRNILDYAKGSRCVLLLDEFDAIAKRRDDAIEVGELKRLVTVLLQEIDNWPSSGLLVAATNHPELLDPAIWRRFDAVIKFDLPSDEHVKLFLTHLLEGQSPELIDAIAILLRGMSFSDIERDVRRSQRQAVLAQQPLSAALSSLVGTHVENLKPRDRKVLALALTKIGYSQHKVHDLTRVSRDTIRKQLSSSEPEDDDADAATQ